MIETDAVAAILADPEVTALIDDRLYPQLAPQGVPEPYVVYYTSVKTGAPCLSGAGEMLNSQMVFQCWADRYGLARELADKVHGALIPLRPATALMVDGYDYQAALHRIVLTESFWE